MKTLLLPLLAACTIGPSDESDSMRPESSPGAILNTASNPSPHAGSADASSCDYTEQEDATNDNTVDTSAVELTPLSFPGTATLCGVINNGHYSTSYETIDVDNYQIYIGSGADLGFIVAVPGAGSAILATGGNVAIIVNPIDGSDEFGVAGGFVDGDIAGFRTFQPPLPAGNYQINVNAVSGSDIPMPLPYTITIVGVE
jgi:hypothetical protein